MAFLEPRAADLRDVAAAHLARTLAEDASAVEPGRERTIGLHELIAHADRGPGQPVSLRLERAFRTDPAAGARYRRVLASLSVGPEEAASAAGEWPTPSNASTRR